METFHRFYLEEVLDGSTFTGWIDLEFDIRVFKKIRLVNIYCHNLQVEQGQISKKFSVGLLKGKEIYLKTFRDKYHKYSTVLVIMYIKEGETLLNVNDFLVEKAMAGHYKETP